MTAVLHHTNVVGSERAKEFAKFSSYFTVKNARDLKNSFFLIWVHNYSLMSMRICHVSSQGMMSADVSHVSKMFFTKSSLTLFFPFVLGNFS